MKAIFPTLALCFAVYGEDWPQFRGPGGRGHSSERGLPLEWTEAPDVGPKHIAWKALVPGAGWSSPAIRGNRAWLTTATDGGRWLRAVALDIKTGRTVLDISRCSV